MAWCFLTLMLEGSALDEMDMVPDKNANEVWKHLKETYGPKGGKANDHEKMKFVQYELESLKEVNDFWEIDIMDADEDGDEVKTESTRKEEVIKDIQVESEWEPDEAVQEKHEPLVEDGEDNPTREESNEELLVEPRETNIESGGNDKHAEEDNEEFSVEPKKHEDVGIQNGFETIQVEMKEKGGEKDAKDGNECQHGEEEIRKHDFKGGGKCLIGDPEVWMEDGNIFAVYLFHEETRPSMEKRKVRETKEAREDVPMKGELEKKTVPKIVREAVSRFKQKANE